MWRVIQVLVWSSAIACSAPSTGRLEVVADTMVLYGGERSELSSYLVGSTNDSLAKQVTLSARHQAVVSTSGRWAWCLREGDSPVEVRAGSRVDSLVIVCRFASKIIGDTYIELEPGDAVVRLGATAFFPDGDSILLRPIRVVSNDSSVVRVQDGGMVPRAVGNARVTADYAGVRLRTAVVVQRTVYDGSITLTAGESRGWQLADGRYTITVKVRSRKDLNRLNMETEGLNCSRDSRDEDTIHCVTSRSAQVTIRNRGKGIGTSTSGEADAQLRIVQTR